MHTIYFCLDDNAPAIRLWPSPPRIGETVSLPEFGGNLSPLKVYDVVWEGFDEPSVSVYLHHAKVDHGIVGESVDGHDDKTSRDGD